MRKIRKSHPRLVAILAVIALLFGVSVIVSPPSYAEEDSPTKAVTWAEALLGQKKYDSLCLKFVSDAYKDGAGVSIGSSYSAKTYWYGHDKGKHTDTDPPSGALVFWDATTGKYPNPDGHVALSIGSGEVISSYERSDHTIHKFLIKDRNAAGYPYLGWMMPPGVDEPGSSTSGNTTPPAPPAQPDLLLARVGTTLYSKVNIGDEWTTQTTAATGVKAAGSRIGITNTLGNLDAKDGPSGTWYTETGAVDQYVVTPNLLVIRVGGTVYAKAQLTDAWATEVGGGATSVQAVDNTMAFLDSNGTLWAKVGVNGEWQQQIGNVSQYVLTSSLLLVRVGNTLYSKTNIGGEWTTQTDAATNVQASGGRIVITATDGTVYAKDGPNGAWYAETGATDQIVVTPNLLIARVGGTIYAKAQLYDAWSTVVGGGATDVQAANNTMAFIDSDGTLWAKVGVSGTWQQEIGNVSQVVVS